MTSCPVPETTPGATFVTSSQNQSRGTYPYDTELTYECREGYSLKSGTLTRLCTVNGTWSGSAPVCDLVKDGYINTILIATGSTVLTCIVFFFLFLIDFYFYRKKKHRNKIIRSREQIKDGQNRPTSFIISKENHKLLPFYTSPLYREPQSKTMDTKLHRRLDSDIQRVLTADNNTGKAGKSSKGKKTKNRKKLTSRLAERSTQTDITLLDSDFHDATSAQPRTRTKKKKHQVGPVTESKTLQPLSLNGTFPNMLTVPDGRPVFPYPDGHPFADPAVGQFIPDVSYPPVRRGRRLPPRPGTNLGGSQGEPAKQEITIIEETAYRMRDRESYS